MTTVSVTDELLRRRPVWQSFIGGKFVEDESTETFDVLEAATGELLARVAVANTETVDRAVRDARRAFEESWRFVSPQGTRCTDARRCGTHS